MATFKGHGYTMKDMWGLTVRGICEYRGRILLLKLRSISAHDAGKWEIPGGKVKRCEFFDDALRREYMEETGLEIEIDSLYNVQCHSKGLHSMQDWREHKIHPAHNEGKRKN